MAQHTRPEVLRTVSGNVTADRPNCHLCSWTYRDGSFTILRPSEACQMHRRLFGEHTPPAPGLLIQFPRAS
jgi:hypothetical protein